MRIINEIKGVFVPPKKRYYLGKLVYGTPYMNPTGFSPTIISVRKLKLKTQEELNKYDERYPHLKQYREDKFKFSNIPMVRRCKDWVVKIFGTYYWIQLGKPWSITTVQLGWKDKFNSPRHEWNPSFQIYFFKWQFCIFWEAPDGNDEKYYEMILWYLKYCNKDIVKAKKTWEWTDYNTKLSTWENKYLLNEV